MSFKYYNILKEKLGREPTKVEIEAFTVMWSEHCGYNHTKRYISMLPKTTNIIGGNAGVVPLDEEWAVAFKVESHNHPSAIEPYNGAATGVGGIIRDILAMGARPHAVLDSLHMGKLVDGIVKGISDYGNSIGVPTVGGELRISKHYKNNPLVNVMATGIVRREQIVLSKASYPGQIIILFGGKTGRDGIHGASFASEDLQSDKVTKLSIQVGDPFTEKLLIEAFLKMNEEKLIEGAQDLGAGGILSATSELASAGGLGAVVYLDRVPLREENMKPWEILISESQERMIVLTNPENVEKIKNIANYYLLDAVVIGKIVRDNMYHALYRENEVINVPIELLTSPPLEPTVEYQPSKEPHLGSVDSFFEYIEPSQVYFQYDYMVGTDTILPPGFGAAVMGIKGSKYGYSVVIHSRGDLGNQDPYWATYIATIEAVRKTMVVGGEPLGITDCVNYGDPDLHPEGLAAMMYGLKDASEFIRVPVVSGNASLYNTTGGISIPPTMVIGMVGSVELGKVIGPREGDIYAIGWSSFSPDLEKQLWKVIKTLHNEGCFLMSPSHWKSIKGYKQSFKEYGFDFVIDKLPQTEVIFSMVLGICNKDIHDIIGSQVPIQKVGTVRKV